MINNLKITDEIKRAIAEHKPVVALESTIITHGLPYPQNLETARLLEKTVRENGAVPATIAILDGVIHIGLEAKELEELSTNTENVYKASRRDLPTVLALKRRASTTVSATMICANLAGIKFFATGGIGGVHRGAEKSFDISADLHEFAKTPVLVVSAGAKAILDIPLTLEYLETLGVTVLGYQTSDMPSFYSTSSGTKVPTKVENPEEAASIFAYSIKLGFKGGILVANPVPEEHALPREEIEEKIRIVIKKAEEQGIGGQRLTPFLLSELFKETGGESVATNIELVKNNARVCAQIAKAFYEQRK
jgi:pseudouridine-5'-phosphate glycosidase